MEENGSSVTMITGASRGIGAELCHEFAAGGDDLVLVARDAVALSALQSELQVLYGVQVQTIPLDLVKPGAIDELAERVRLLGLRVDRIVNNAAIAIPGPLGEQAKGLAVSELDLNVRVPVEIIASHLPAMIERGRGSILNVASLAAAVPVPGLAAYSAGKACLVSLSRSLHAELRHSGVHVSVLIPGPTRTQMWSQIQNSESGNRIRSLVAMSPRTVAKAAYEGLLAERVVITPGFLNWLAWVFSRILPTWLISPIISWLMKPNAATS